MLAMKRWGWIGIGAAVGYVLGTRAGRERYEQLTHNLGRVGEQVGLPTARDKVVDSAKSAGAQARDLATDRASHLVDTAATKVSETIDAARPGGAGTNGASPSATGSPLTGEFPMPEPLTVEAHAPATPTEGEGEFPPGIQLTPGGIVSDTTQ